MAGLSSISIKRPVLAIVMSLTIILFGLIGFNYLGVREFPSVDPPVINVSTSYVGANADVMESQITEPLEDAINGIPGVRTISSSSSEGRSNITVEFELSVDMETAANDVRDKVSGALNQLPPDVDPPVVSKADADASPMFYIRIISTKRDALELSRYAENYFSERLQTVPGVSAVRIWGQKKYSMRLWMDPIKLAGLKLASSDVLQALNRENVELPSGRVEGANTELTVKTMGRLTTVEDFNNLIIKETGDQVVRLSDVGYAQLYPENDRTMLRSDGFPAVTVALIAQPGSNAVDIANRAYQKLEQLNRDLPPDIEYSVFDTSVYIRSSIQEVQETVIIAFVLVVFIIFAFLRDWRTTIIPVVTIPISLIGSFFFMYLMGFSINVLTMLGIVLAIGLVVDDTIVVLENIYSKVEDGEDPNEAANTGSEEIYFAVISTTVAVVTVFLPIIFLEGLTGKLFKEFGLVVSSSVLISSFVALSLTPMMCSKILKSRSKKPWLYLKTEPFFSWLETGYNNSLESFMKRRWVAFIIIGISVVLIYIIGISLPAELAPMEDRGQFRIMAQAPEGSTFEFMDRNMVELDQFVRAQIPEAQNSMTITSPSFGGGGSVNSGMIFMVLNDADQRDRSQQEIIDAINPLLRNFTSVRLAINQPPTIGDRRSGFPVQYVLQAGELEKLKVVLPEFMARASESPKFSFVDNDLKFTKPELNININRDKARTLGVSIFDVAQTLQLGLSGSRFGNFIMDGKQYQIIGQFERINRDRPLDLKTMYVKNRYGELIQLDNLVTMNEASTPPRLTRFNRYSSAKVSAQLASGVALGEGIEEMDRIAKEVLDETYVTSLDGASREFVESSGSIYMAFILALVIIYLVLAAQFESFRDPFIIMFTVPLAVAGATIALWYFSETLNIFSQIGVIMLIGLVTKNGILIVEFANQRKAKGLERMGAVIGAAEARFRPIIMTSLSTVLGILPIALALGAGSESRVSMGIAVIGGMVFSTLLTLYVIPAIYSYMSSRESNVSIQ